MAKYNGATVTMTAALTDNTFVTITFVNLSTQLVALGALGELTETDKAVLGQPA